MLPWLRALNAVVSRETIRFLKQTSRLVSAIVRPALWLVVFASGFQNVLGISITPPYETYITYDVYLLPGLLGMVLLFQGMQSSLALVFDREVGLLRLLLTAPFPRWSILLAKLIAGTALAVLQGYVFLLPRLPVRRGYPPPRVPDGLPGDRARRLHAGGPGPAVVGLRPAARELRGHDELRDLSGLFLDRALPSVEGAKSGATWIATVAY